MNIACILAGGLGVRMQKIDPPKQYMTLFQKPVLLWSMQAFDDCENVDLLCIVATRRYHAQIRLWARKAGLKKPLCFALPGRERFESAYAALCAASPLCAFDDILLFHDAARPLVSKRIINDNLRLAKTHGGVYTAVPSSDSVFMSEDGRSLSSLLPRHALWQGQTPQSFRFGIISEAHARYREMHNPPPVTDDCSLVHLLGESIAICLGDKRNLKITTNEDLLFLEALLTAEAQTHQPMQTCDYTE